MARDWPNSLQALLDIDMANVDTYLDQRTRQAEHVLQLLILDRSLAQLQGA